MPLNGLIIALSLLGAGLPTPAGGSAPAGTPATRYCLRVDPIIGSRIETIQCMTRQEWADLDVDVDQEWAQNGVRVEG
jgi:anaerobic glycerol-3-phosphate dehydrogenase